ncbi:MAG TPA: 5-deoxy-glucuronate isomerase, partial [Phycisphaerae bacterium]|nr:5-deoxy-glucuronate isomerase [Phycisphaerae bacterium]
MAKLLSKSCMPTSGYRQVVPVAKKPLEVLGFGLANLAAGKTWTFDTKSCEWTIVILSGSVRAFLGKDELTSGPLGSRAGVFGGVAAAVYLPPKCRGRIEAHAPAQLAVCQALSETGAEPTVITPDDVRTKTVGVHNWQREV